MYNEQIQKIQRHESGVKKMYNEAHGIEYKPLKNLEEARQYDDAYLIMQGDYGGQIYLSAPIKIVKCDMEALEKLLEAIDMWSDSEGRRVFFERMQIGKGIVGGMGGGLTDNTLWLHEELENQHDEVLKVLSGEKKKLS